MLQIRFLSFAFFFHFAEFVSIDVIFLRVTRDLQGAMTSGQSSPSVWL
jgi:hypothetical protein